MKKSWSIVIATALIKQVQTISIVIGSCMGLTLVRSVERSGVMLLAADCSRANI
jgi:hypothetical protein